MSDVVLVRDDNEIRVITLNRPHRLNAINPPLLRALNEALREGQQDPDIGAMVLAGAGRAFCAGDDLIEQQSMQGAGRSVVLDFVESIQDVTRNIMFGDTPVVAAVQGWAVGGAFSWPLNCDLSIWSEEARAFLPELRIGLFVSGAITFLLPREIGAQSAREMIYLSKELDAGTLSSLGLAAELVAREELLGTAISRARQLAKLPAEPRAKTKRALLTPDRADIKTALATETEVIVECLCDPQTFARIEQESGLGGNKAG